MKNRRRLTDELGDRIDSLELTCYRIQLGFSTPDQLGAHAKHFARFIATRYGLKDVTQRQALTDLLTG